MATNNMHNLTTLIKRYFESHAFDFALSTIPYMWPAAKLCPRLEAATARLEDIASSTIDLPQAVAPPPTTSLRSGSNASTPAPPQAPVPQAPAEPIPESIEEFDQFIATSVKQYIKLSEMIGGLVAEQVGYTKAL
jgi:adenylyl cyclase-associated protein